MTLFALANSFTKMPLPLNLNTTLDKNDSRRYFDKSLISFYDGNSLAC